MAFQQQMTHLTACTLMIEANPLPFVVIPDMPRYSIIYPSPDSFPPYSFWPIIPPGLSPSHHTLCIQVHDSRFSFPCLSKIYFHLFCFDLLPKTMFYFILFYFIKEDIQESYENFSSSLGYEHFSAPLSFFSFIQSKGIHLHLILFKNFLL